MIVDEKPRETILANAQIRKRGAEAANQHRADQTVRGWEGRAQPIEVRRPALAESDDGVDRAEELAGQRFDPIGARALKRGFREAVGWAAASISRDNDFDAIKFGVPLGFQPEAVKVGAIVGGRWIGRRSAATGGLGANDLPGGASLFAVRDKRQERDAARRRRPFRRTGVHLVIEALAQRMVGRHGGYMKFLFCATLLLMDFNDGVIAVKRLRVPRKLTSPE